ncbi:hypothetical protein HQ560_09145 [bacterium]|nr:hypothetical protein [bacterium]
MTTPTRTRCSLPRPFATLIMLTAAALLCLHTGCGEAPEKGPAPTPSVDHVVEIKKLTSKDGDPDGVAVEMAVKRYLVGLTEEEGWNAARQWCDHIESQTQGKDPGEGWYLEMCMVLIGGAFDGSKETLRKSGLDRFARELRQRKGGVHWRSFLVYFCSAEWNRQHRPVQMRLELVDLLLETAGSAEEDARVRGACLSHTERVLYWVHRNVQDQSPPSASDRASVQERLKRLESQARGVLTQETSPCHMVPQALSAVAMAWERVDPAAKPDIELVRSTLKRYPQIPEGGWLELLRAAKDVLPKAEVESVYKEMMQAVKDEKIKDYMRFNWRP